MKIAITGHSAGIGQALAQCYADRGYDVVGLSKRNGYNIRVMPRVIDAIEPCDVFVNNAQTGFAQTELLFEIQTTKTEETQTTTTTTTTTTWKKSQLKGSVGSHLIYTYTAQL
jgi:short-subunit dehydrogenase